MISNPFLATIILAAGKGTRMKSNRPKVLHEVFFEPMVHHVVKAVQPLGAEKSIVIVGHQKERVEGALTGFHVTCVEQQEQNGTGHAVLCAEQSLAGFSGDVLILCGDSPLLLTHHLVEMVQAHRAADSPLTIITTSLENPTNYGRIISDTDGNVREVIEEKDATDEQRKVREVNAGIYCVEKEFLFNALKQVTTDNSQGEMYLTDIVAIAVRQGCTVHKYEHPVPDHVLGVNSRVELSKAHEEIQARRNHQLMDSGITMYNPATISVAPTSRISSHCTLTHQVTISGSSTIEEGCTIQPGVFIKDATIGNNSYIGPNSVICDATIPAHSRIPPMTTVVGST